MKIMTLLKIKITLVVVLLGFSAPIFAQTNTYTGATRSNWGVAGNWSLGLVPLLAHDVVIPDNVVVLIDVPSAVCNSLLISTGANSSEVSVGANALTVTGIVTIETPTANNKNKIVSVTSGTLSCGSVFMQNTGGNTRDCRLTVTSGIINVSGNITMDGATARNQVILGDAVMGGVLNIGGNFSGTNGGDLIPGDFSTVNFNGSAPQIIKIGGGFVYNDIVINNTSGATFSANVTAARVLGNITVQTGILNNGGFSAVGNAGKIFTIANGATFLLSGATSAFPTVFGTNIGATSIIEYAGTGNQPVFDVLSPGYGHLIVSAGLIKTAGAGLDVQGNITINSGVTLALTTNTHAIQGNLINNGTLTTTSGTLNLSGNLTNTGIFTGGTTSTVNLSGDLINTGTVTAGTGLSNFNCGGNWTNNGIFTSGSLGKVTFNSTISGKTISGTTTGATGKFNDLSFNGVGGSWTIANDLDVAKIFDVTNGSVLMDGLLSLAGSTPVTIATGAVLTIENNASLIQSGYTGANSGSINVKRSTTPIIRFDFTYWSSPTNGTQTLLNFSPNTLTDKFFSYHNAWAFTGPSTATFSKGIGYAIRAPQVTNATIPAPLAHQFTGEPNNGNIDVAVVTNPLIPISNRLIGNPYPSAIDADAFISANLGGSGTINQTISGTLYFWTHNHTVVGNNYASSDYATYNLSGGTAVATGSGNTSAPTKYIASGQAFFVHTIADGTVSFRNTMRTGVSNSNFYRNANATTSAALLESHRIWLNLTNSTASFSQALVGYIETATNGIDPGFDGLYYGGDLHVLYSLIGTGTYTIQARALPFVDTDIVPLGFATNVAGNTTISIDHVDGAFSGAQNIYLEDQLLNVTHDLKLSPYTFHSETGTYNSRFLLRYIDTPLGIENINPLTNAVTIASQDQVIKVVSEKELMEQVVIYDILGRQIYENKKVNSNALQISNLTSHQTVIVKISLTNGNVVTKKLIY